MNVASPSGSCAASPPAPARSSAAKARGSDDSSGRSATPIDSTAGRCPFSRGPRTTRPRTAAPWLLFQRSLTIFRGRS